MGPPAHGPRDNEGKGSVHTYRARGKYKAVVGACGGPQYNAVSLAMLLYVLLIFYCLCAVYLAFGVHNKRFMKCLLKCLPTLTLLLYTVAILISLGKDQDSVLKKSRIIKLFWSLTFSCIGDGCLVFPAVFFVGVLSFAVSLLLYINVLEVVDSFTYMTFEGVLSGICIFFLYVLVVMTIKITSRSYHFPKVPMVMTLLILVYYFILSMLLWSGVMLFLRQRDLVGVGAVVGVAMFYISDLLIAASAFWNLRLLQGRALIMLTYYTAQLLLTLSLVFLE